MNILKGIASAWLRVDLRTLGIFRVALGFVCLVDILRRIPYIEVFYSRDGVAPNYFMSEISGRSSSKAFTFLSSLNTVPEVTVFFLIAALFSFFLMIGYKTRLSHIITIITILSIHNRLIILENGGDLVLNNFLIWAAFLPLGKRFSFDRVLSSLRDIRDDSPKSLNQENLRAKNEPRSYWGVAYFACLLQLAIIYLFNYFNKDGNTWEQGTSIYYFYQLDTFLTPIGNFVKEFGLMPLALSKVLTYMTMCLELLVPFLLLIPVLTLWTRRFTFVVMIGFHVIIGISLYIGTFSWIMIAALLLLLSSRDIDLLARLLKKFSTGPYIVFYDSDCGFCHQCARIIRRMDLFGHLTWAGKDWDRERPSELNDLRDSTIVVWDQKADLVYTRHKAFCKISEALPFGFIDACILRIPGISHLSGFIYDIIAKNRTSISRFFGYSACDISRNHTEDGSSISYQLSVSGKLLCVFKETAKSIAVIILMLAAVQYALTKNDGFKDWQKKRGYEALSYSYNLNKISRQTRMIQKWNMFSPNTPRSFQWVIIEAKLKDGTTIDLMTGKEPVYDRLGYETYKEIDNSQFWRKYLGRISKKTYKRYRPQLQKVLLSSNNPLRKYDDLNQDGAVDNLDRIESVALYKLTKSVKSPLIENNKEKKVRKIKIDFKSTGSSKSSKRSK